MAGAAAAVRLRGRGAGAIGRRAEIELQATSAESSSSFSSPGATLIEAPAGERREQQAAADRGHLDDGDARAGRGRVHAPRASGSTNSAPALKTLPISPTGNSAVDETRCAPMTAAICCAELASRRAR